MHWRNAHIWLNPKVPGSARMDNYRSKASASWTPSPSASRKCSNGTEWSATGNKGPSTAPTPTPACSWRSGSSNGGGPNYLLSFAAHKPFDTAPHGALHLILRHLSVTPEVINLLLFLHTCARLLIVTAHRLTQPVHMLRGVQQGNPESPLLYALLLEPLLRAHRHRLRPPGEAERGSTWLKPGALASALSRADSKSCMEYCWTWAQAPSGTWGTWRLRTAWKPGRSTGHLSYTSRRRGRWRL